MESMFIKKVESLLKRKESAKRWMIVFLCLAVIAGVGTYAALKLNGQAVTKKNRELECAYQVHTHTAECYADVDGQEQLVCGYADYVVHIHNDDCYDGDGVLVCPLPEIEPHIHDDSCYTIEQNLVCGQEEFPGHVHDDTCFDGEGNVICGQEESEGHVHSDACYAEEKTLVCDKLELHTHTDECYGIDDNGTQKLVCGLLELKEHTHGEECLKETTGISLQETSEPSQADQISNNQEVQIHESDQFLDEPQTVSNTNDDNPIDGDLKGFVDRVEVKNTNGDSIGDGVVHVGENYQIHLEFKEKGAQHDQFTPQEKKLYYQIPDSFKVPACNNVPLTVVIDGVETQIGTYSIDENGMLTIELSDEGMRIIEASNETLLTFDMEAIVQASSSGKKPDFGGAGGDFTFEVTDQPKVSMSKQGTYVENADKTGGNLTYTVEAEIEHGNLDHAAITDVLTPPQTDAFAIEMEEKDGIPDVTVRVMRSGQVYTLRSDEYTLIEVPDSSNPGKKTFRVELTGNNYDPLLEGDTVYITYRYNVEYVDGVVGLFQGNVRNEAEFTATMPVEDPATGEVNDIPADEKFGCTVWVERKVPGHGVVCKDQRYDIAKHTLHYTLYTVVPKGNWTPFYIQDNMAVEFGGERYNLDEFKEDGRVKNLTVSAMDLDTQLDGWNDNTDNLTKIDDLEALKGRANILKGYDMGLWDNLPADYNPKSVENYICLWLDNNLEIVFGKREFGQTDLCGNWEYSKDRLIIVEYDLDMSDNLGNLDLINTSDYITRLEKSADEVMKAGITNTVNMRFGGYFPGYSVYFNNAKTLNKTGDLDKNTNTIDYTVTLNTTDKTANEYFRDVKNDWMGLNAVDKYNWGNMKQAYKESMQAVFYDKLPDGWEYVEDSLTVTACNRWGNQSSYPYDMNNQLELQPVTQDGDKQVIKVPLIFFYDANNYLGIGNLFDWFNENLVSLTFTYKLKADDEWLKAHAADVDETIIHNEATIRDSSGIQWAAGHDIAYYPARLTKKAERVGDSNLMKFTLDINPGGVDLDEEKDYLIVTDTSRNLQIQTDSITVLDTADGHALQAHGEVMEDEQIGNDAWGFLSSVPDTEDGHQFRLIVPDGKALTVQYNALIPEKGVGVSISNSASIEGVERADSGYSDTLNVTNITGGGSVNTYGLTIAKVDSNDRYKMLPGAKFQYYVIRQKDSSLTHTDMITVNGKTYDCHTEPGWQFTTGEDGVFKIKNEMNWLLEPGSYYILKELEAPNNYILPDSPILFYYGAANEADTDNYPGAVYALPNGTLTITNDAMRYQLPETGGPGVLPLYVIVLSLFTLAGWISYEKCWKRGIHFWEGDK